MIDKCRYCGSKNLALINKDDTVDMFNSDKVFIVCSNCHKYNMLCPKKKITEFLNRNKKPQQTNTTKDTDYYVVALKSDTDDNITNVYQDRLIEYDKAKKIVRRLNMEHYNYRIYKLHFIEVE